MIRMRALLISVLLLLIATTACATQVVEQDTRALAKHSSDIVIGTVETVRCYWNPSHSRILTDVGVRVGESLKGTAAPRITLTQLGGELDGLKLTVEGSPRFVRGQETLLFVWRDSKGRAQVNGLAQGKYDIVRDTRTGEQRVSRPLLGLALRDARTRQIKEAPRAAEMRSLDEIKREIRQALAEDGR